MGLRISNNSKIIVISNSPGLDSEWRGRVLYTKITVDDNIYIISIQNVSEFQYSTLYKIF